MSRREFLWFLIVFWGVSLSAMPFPFGISGIDNYDASVESGFGDSLTIKVQKGSSYEYMGVGKVAYNLYQNLESFDVVRFEKSEGKAYYCPRSGLRAHISVTFFNSGSVYLDRQVRLTKSSGKWKMWSETLSLWKESGDEKIYYAPISKKYIWIYQSSGSKTRSIILNT